MAKCTGKAMAGKWADARAEWNQWTNPGKADTAFLRPVAQVCAKLGLFAAVQ